MSLAQTTELLLEAPSTSIFEILRIASESMIHHTSLNLSLIQMRSPPQLNLLHFLLNLLQCLRLLLLLFFLLIFPPRLLIRHLPVHRTHPTPLADINIRPIVSELGMSIRPLEAQDVVEPARIVSASTGPVSLIRKTLVCEGITPDVSARRIGPECFGLTAAYTGDGVLEALAVVLVHSGCDMDLSEVE
jgi:hypothetical protein